MTKHHATLLETVSVTVPEAATAAYEAALTTVCASVGFFRNDATGGWRVEGVKAVAVGDAALAVALALAEAATGIAATLERRRTPAGGWLARTRASFPEQRIGRGFAVRGTHLRGPASAARITLTLDAGLAFGSGEHGSTRGCLRALESVAWRRPRRILDLGTGSGILAMAAARLLRRPVRADRYRAVVGASGAAECPAERAVAPGSRQAWRMAGAPRRCAAAHPMTWCSLTSWRGRCARWPRTLRPTLPLGAGPSCRGCLGVRHVGWSRPTSGAVCDWNAASPKASGRRWCYADRQLPQIRPPAYQQPQIRPPACPADPGCSRR